MRIGVLAYDGCFAAEIFVFTDVLSIANHVTQKGNPFDVALIGKSPTVQAAGGFPIGVSALDDDYDLIVVPGFELVGGLGKLPEWSTEIEYLRTQGRVASVCVGAFLLGEAGLLDGRRVTTSWLFAERLAARYPAASVCSDELIIEDGPITTSAAFSASLDLATALVREHFGERVARATARITLVGNRSSQSPYVVEAMIPDTNGPFAQAVGQWLVEHLGDPYDLARLAAAFHVSERTLLRKFNAEGGQSPLAFLQDARVSEAKRLLVETDQPLAEIVRSIGYQDQGTFRRLFVGRVGLSTGDYRRQFAR